MNTILNNTLKTLALGLVLTATIYPAQATPTPIAHTYVSGTTAGSDGNPCTRLSPCATFQGALTKTTSGGLITALDTGEYGAVSISQSVTIDGTGTQASIVIISGDAIDIDAGTGKTVILRHLTLTGLSNSGNGVFVLTGNLVMDDCKISGFGTIGIVHDSVGAAVVENTSITGGNTGVLNKAGSLSLRNMTIQGNTLGLDTELGAVEISHSLITQNTTGLLAIQSTLSVLNCIVTSNGTGIDADTGGIIRLTGNDIFNNATGIVIAGSTPGIVSTAGNNHKAGSTTPGAPTPGKVIVTQ